MSDNKQSIRRGLSSKPSLVAGSCAQLSAAFLQSSERPEKAARSRRMMKASESRERTSLPLDRRNTQLEQPGPAALNFSRRLTSRRMCTIVPCAQKLFLRQKSLCCRSSCVHVWNALSSYHTIAPY